MPTIDFEAVQPGYAVNYSEDGYTITSELAKLAPEFNEALWSGKSFSNVTAGGYFLNNYSSDIISVKRDGAKEVFGAKSIKVDGFDWGPFDGGVARTGTSAVTFTFRATRASDYTTIEWTVSAPTDGQIGFETINLPKEFHAGLIDFSWSVEGGSGWGAFDDLVVVPNNAPVAKAFTASVTAGQSFTGKLTATDADNTTTTNPEQPLVFQTVGELPEGVYVGEDGTIEVQPLDGDAGLISSRTITFKYKAFDGAEYSSEQTATITVKPLPAGPDIKGTRKADSLKGTEAREKIYGLEGNDKISANGGSDKVWGDDGADTISGGTGDDWLFGEDDRDKLDGGDGADTISGGDDCDTIIGGAGNDTLCGGDDKDNFVFDEGFGRDIIVDFRSGRWEGRGCNDDWGHWGAWGRNHGHSHARDSHGSRWGGRDDDLKWIAGDTITISPSVFGSFDEMMENAEQTLLGVRINAPDGESSIFLVGVSLRSLDVEDFVFA
jgi:hypothetical protein